jgi:hypothetical protein
MSGSNTGAGEITAVLGTQSVAAVTLEATGQRTLAIIMLIALAISVLAIATSRLSVGIRNRR